MPPKAALKGQPPAPEPSLKIFGSFFLSEMRTMYAILELNEIPYSLAPMDDMDVLTKEGNAKYLGFNPSGMTPTIIDGFYTIVGDPPTLYKYICKTKNVDDKFYPSGKDSSSSTLSEMSKEKKKLIDQYLEYIQWMIKRVTSRIFKMKIERVMLEKDLIDENELKGNEVFEQQERDIFFNIIVPNVEQQLENGKSYLGGYDLCLADIALFNEMINAIEILELNVDAKKFPNVEKWMVRMEDIAPVRKATIKFQDELKKLKEKFKVA